MSPDPSPTPSPTYNRDAIIASMLRYYTLLSRTVSIPPTSISPAPNTGRRSSSLPLQQVRLLGFNDTMIDFIRHAPFVESNNRPVYYSTCTLNYYPHLFRYAAGEYAGDDAQIVEMWPVPGQRVAEGILPLARPLQGDGRGYWWLLDTGSGELTAHGPCLERPPGEVPAGEEWRSARPVPATEYFDGLWDHVMALRIVALPGLRSHVVWDMWPTEGMEDRRRWAHEAKEIYVSCRWPTARLKSELEERGIYDEGDWPTVRWFQRAKCRRLLVEMLERYRGWDREERAKRLAE